MSCSEYDGKKGLATEFVTLPFFHFSLSSIFDIVFYAYCFDFGLEIIMDETTLYNGIFLGWWNTIISFCFQNCSDILFTRKNCSSDWEKLLKFEADCWEFEKCLSQYSQENMLLKFLK